MPSLELGARGGRAKICGELAGAIPEGGGEKPGVIGEGDLLAAIAFGLFRPGEGDGLPKGLLRGEEAGDAERPDLPQQVSERRSGRDSGRRRGDSEQTDGLRGTGRRSSKARWRFSSSWISQKLGGNARKKPCFSERKREELMGCSLRWPIGGSEWKPGDHRLVKFFTKFLAHPVSSANLSIVLGGTAAVRRSFDPERLHFFCPPHSTRTETSAVWRSARAEMRHSPGARGQKTRPLGWTGIS